VPGHGNAVLPTAGMPPPKAGTSPSAIARNATMAARPPVQPLFPKAKNLKLVCHIGTPKTASTFLQNTFVANAAWLARHGITYPDRLSANANHITLLFASEMQVGTFARGYGLHSPEDAAAFRTTLRDTIEKRIAEVSAGVGTMLMSSENLTGNMRLPGIRNLHAMLAPLFDDIRIVVYLRRQDDAILSMYAEFMRKGFTGQTFDDFMAHCLDHKTAPPYLYARRMLREWAEVFGKSSLVVRLFDRGRMKDGDILRDFLLHGLRLGSPDLAGLTPSSRNNPSLSAPALEFLRRLHPAIPFARDGKPNPCRSRLEKRIDRLPQHPRPTLSERQSRRIMQHFAGINEWVRAEYFPNDTAPLFPDNPDLPEDGNLGRVGLDEFSQFAGVLLQ